MLSSIERIIKTLEHKEPDRIPIDLGGTFNTSITIKAYKKLLSYLGISKKEIQPMLLDAQVAKVDEDVIKIFGVDVKGLFPHSSSNWKEEERQYFYLVDEWGVKRRMPKKNGLYYDVVNSPLSGEINKTVIDKYSWPNATDPIKGKNLERIAKETLRKGYPLIMNGWGDTFFTHGFYLRGFEQFYIDLAVNPSMACYLMDKIIDIKMKYWEFVFQKLGNYIKIVALCDDLGGQSGLNISAQMYRKYIKPRQKKLISFIRKVAPHPVYIFLHSCGSIYDIIPDLIEIGVDILNPIQVGAAKMNTKNLKKRFGEKMTFWGGGIDTQHTLPYGTPQQVKNEVKRRIDDLAPGGGFVFACVHNIQPDVPVENIYTVFDTVIEYGRYS